MLLCSLEVLFGNSEGRISWCEQTSSSFVGIPDSESVRIILECPLCCLPSTLYPRKWWGVGGEGHSYSSKILLISQLTNTCLLPRRGSSRDQGQQDLSSFATHSYISGRLWLISVCKLQASQPCDGMPASAGKPRRAATLAAQILPPCHGSLLPIRLARSLTSTIWSLCWILHLQQSLPGSLSLLSANGTVLTHKASLVP